MELEIGSPEWMQAMLQVDTAFWAERSQIRLIGGQPFIREGYEYQTDILRSDADEKAIMKCAQSGITTIFMLDCIHGLINGQYPQGCIYYFPNKVAVEAFSKTRFGPLLEDNPAIKRHLKSTNSVNIKKVGDAMLSLLGCSASVDIQGKKDSSSVRSTPADYVIRDERDLFNETMVQMTKDRLQNSKIGKEVDLGTPTIPDYGIAKVFNESDQRHWMIPCPQCHADTCLVDEFPNCVHWKDNEPYFACKKCGNRIEPNTGRWVAKYPDRRIAGWLISHLITPNLKLAKVMDRWERDQREGNIGTFYNGVLGLPYIPAEDRLTHSDIYACCGSEGMRTDISLSQTAMGVDVGKRYHTVTIAQKIDDKRAKLIYMARVKGFQAVHDIAQKYNVKSAVVDCRPYEEAAQSFQDNETYKVFLAEYKDKQGTFCKVDEKQGRYSLLRNQIFDRSHALIKNQQLEIPRKCEEVEEFAKQMCNCAKVLEENEQGDRIYRYVKLGDDHYRSSVNYLIIALDNLHHYYGQSVARGKRAKSYDDPLMYDL